MTRSLAALVAVAFCATALVPGGGAAVPAPQALGTEFIGGVLWTTDLQVTFDALDDYAPIVTVDAWQRANLIWTRAVGANGSYYYERIDRSGAFEHNETFIDGVPGQSTSLSPFRGSPIAVDSRGNIHLVSENGSRDINYRQFDQNGTLVVAEKGVLPQDLSNSSLPSVALQGDDSVHMAYADYKFQCEDVLYSKLDSSGGQVWTNRVVSSDVQGTNEGVLIETSDFNGNVLFSWGSENGSRLGRFDKFGAKNMATVTFRPNPDFKVADVAETPDGNMHLLWEGGGALHYARVNASGALVVADTTIVNSTAIFGAPRIEARSDNAVAFVWSEVVSGRSQVMYGSLLAAASPASVTPIQVSNATGNATEPALAIDPDDNAVIVWVDDAGGNRDLYLKRELGCGVELYAAPYSGDMGFIHPNQTYVLPLYLKNKGLFRDRFTISMNATSQPGRPMWTVGLAPAVPGDLDPGAVFALNLTVQAPANVVQGDHITIQLNASNDGPPSCFDTMQLEFFARITRSVRLSANQTNFSADYGTQVVVAFQVRNTGDIFGELIRLEWIAGQGPSWPISIDTASVVLDPGQSAAFNATITIPSTAPGGVTASFGFNAYAAADRSASDALLVTVTPNEVYGFVLTVDSASKFGDPGGTVPFVFTIETTGNVASKWPAEFFYTNRANETIPGLGSVNLPTLDLRSGDTATVAFEVRIPESPAAGDILAYEFYVFSEGFQVLVSLPFTVTVNTHCAAEWDAPTWAVADAEGVARFDGWFLNRGNMGITVNASITGEPLAWVASFSSPLTGVGSFSVPRSEGRLLNLTIRAPVLTLAGNYSLRTSIEAGPCPTLVNTITVEVQPRPAFTLTPGESEVAVPPGGEALVTFVVNNTGNVWLKLRFNASTSREALEPDVLLRRGAGSPDLEVSATHPLDLAPGASITLVARVRANISALQADGEVQVEVMADVGLTQVFALQVSVARSQLRAASVGVSPLLASAGQEVRFTVVVDNGGRGHSPGGTVRCTVDGAPIAVVPFAALAANSTTTADCVWVAVEGTHRVVFEIVEGEGGTETALSDNALTYDIAVLPARAAESDAGAAWLFGLGGVVAVLAAVPAVLALRARRRGPPPNP